MESLKIISHLKKKLTKLGYKFYSETDSEVIAHLLDNELKRNNPKLAMKKMLEKLEGAFAIAIMFKDLNLLAGSRKGSPLALGISDDSTFIGSDSVALAPFTKKIIFLDEGDSVFIEESSFQIFDEDFKKVKRKSQRLGIQIKKYGKGKFQSFYAKKKFLNNLILLEIH